MAGLVFSPWRAMENLCSNTFIESAQHPDMPNALRCLVDPDEDLVVVMVPIWCDDISGNKSKQFNKHMNLYMVNSNLPGQLLQQEYFVKFVSTSPNASTPEQWSAIREQLKYILLVTLPYSC